ncbi:hypothetical protein N7519_010477 [Penicillium mononematosum]|uniref:uncharacterized protein n=1 Tax=Penicillium mononematosum TaxID=268346 RepID=UPI0025474534|nr:uncharacterized protein N7519_010477 [Penicillium mononematosum]KAJ6180016.1 hypothetical protein N7519_010477 [Penicillium mononematosum]
MSSHGPKIPPSEDEQLFNQLLAKVHTEEELKKHHFTMVLTYALDPWARLTGGVIGRNEFAQNLEHTEDAAKRQGIVLDCEMVTVEGNRKELAFLAVVDMFTGETLINHFVHLTNIVRNWRTKYSGIICAAMKAAVKDNIAIRGWEAARTMIFDHTDGNTIIVGHALNNDLNSLGIIHSTIIDTSILTADAVYRPLGRPFRRTWSLKTLANELIGQKIQGGKRGHSALEDTMATRDVLLHCTRNPLDLEAWAEKVRSEEAVNPETRQFAEARSKELQQKQRSSLRPSSQRSSYTEIEGAFCEQIKPYLCAFVRVEATDGPPSNLLSPIGNAEIGKDVAAYLEQQGVEGHLWAFPTGSTEARIGFVLDFDIPSLECDEESTSQTHFPSALRSVGFHKENCLTWPFNFQAPFVPRKLKLAGPGHTRLRDINRQIIDNSNLQVIILCGVNALRMSVLPSPSFEKRTLTFGQASLEAFLQIEQSVVTRVYLNPLAPLSALYSDDWRSGTMVSLAIKVAACLTQTRGIQPFYFRSRVALSELVRIRLREEDGEPKLTSDSITDSIWSWLYMRGFKPSDIPRLETIGGSVSRGGILLAMITSPSRPKEPNQTPEPRIIPRDNPSLFSRKFTEFQLQEMRKLHTQKQAEWDLEHANSTKKLSEGEDGDLLREDEVSEGQEGVNLNEHVLGLITDSTPPRTKTAKDSRKAEPPTTTKDSRKAGSPMAAFQPAKKRTNDTVPPDRRGKDRNCCWCKKPTYGKNTYPCWCEALQGSLCQQCSIILSHNDYLPIFKHHILHLDVFCGFCGSLFGPGWKWEPGSGLPACSAECHAGLKQKSKRPEAGQQTQQGFRYQDTISEKLPMTAKLRQYFKNKFGIDTSREGLKATTKKNSLVAEL